MLLGKVFVLVVLDESRVLGSEELDRFLEVRM